jgi:hypothetical protein
LGSLGALGKLYDERELRWADEMRKMNEERERVTLLMRQVLGEGAANAGLGGGSLISPNSTGTGRSP